MEKYPKEYYEKICRACLTESDTLKSLFTKLDGEYRTLAEALKSITNINYKFEGLPTQVCKTCEDFMYKTEAFKKLCIESEAALQEALVNIDKVDDPAGLSSNATIKHETDIDTGKESVTCTFCMVLCKDLTALNFHVKSSHNGKNLDIFSQIASSSNPKESIDVKTTKKENFESIKEEDDDFDADSLHFEIDIEPVQIGIDINNELNNDDVPLSKLLKRKRTKNSSVKPRKKLKAAFPGGKIQAPKEEPSVIKSESEIDDGLPKLEKFCEICHIEFETVKQFKLHQRRHVKKEDKDKQKYQCPMCMRRFVKKTSLNEHLKTHDESAVIKYVCITCKREFQHQAHLDNHVLNVHTREKGFSCDTCNKCFTTQECLDIHKESHKNEKRHQCTLCSKSFVMLSTLTDHMRTHTGEKPFLCFQCGKGFSQKNNLAQHMRRHAGLKPFKCETCDRSFVSKGELVAHHRKHSGAHPFICDDCGHGFTTSSSLVKHRRIHTGERPYACDLCSMRFAASGTLKNHRRTHTGEKPFQCSYCEKAFIQRQDLVSHIRCHTGERPFVCSTCGQPFRKASALKTHYKMHIKEPLQLQRDVNMTVLQNAILSGMQDELKI